VIELGSNRNAIYKMMFDARRKLRGSRHQWVSRRRGIEALMNGSTALDRFLQTDPRDVGCAEAMAMLHVYADLMAASGQAAERYSGIAAHLRACGPCGEDFEGLLAIVQGDQQP
jgi:hypothetical protein